MKTITLTRSELIWETRHNTWTEEDWNNLLKWMKETIEDSNEHEESYWRKKNKAAYDVLKDLTWEQAVAEFDKGYEGLSWQVDNSYKDSQGNLVPSSYKETVYELICEYMREENYDQDVDECNYADDFDENFVIGD